MEARPKVYDWFTEARVTYWAKVLLLLVLAAYVLGGVLTFLERIGSISIILIASIFFAYLLYPAVRKLNERLPLVACVLIVYAFIAVLIVASLTFIVPAVSYDIVQIANHYPSTVAHLQTDIRDPSNRLFGRLPMWMRNEMVNAPGTLARWVRTHGYDATLGALGFLVASATALAAIVIVPVLSAYLLLDSENIKRYFIALIPQKRRERSLDVLMELEQVIGGFIRGQLLVGISVGILITLMLMIMHVPYAALIGLSAAIVDIIPYVGAVVTFVPAVLLAYFNHGAGNAIVVAVLFIAIFEMEGHLIAPNIVSKTVSLSPLTVILAILIGGELMGLVGMFIAVPAAGMLRVIAYHIMPAKATLEEAQPADGRSAHRYPWKSSRSPECREGRRRRERHSA